MISVFINIFSTQLCDPKGQKEKYASQHYFLLSIIKNKFPGHMLKYIVFDLDWAHFDCIFLLWSIFFCCIFLVSCDFERFFFKFLLIIFLADPGKARGCSTNSLVYNKLREWNKKEKKHYFFFKCYLLTVYSDRNNNKTRQLGTVGKRPSPTELLH